MITVYIVDKRGVLLYTKDVDPYSAQPANAVYEEPPEFLEGFTRIWNQSWQQVPDSEVPDIPVNTGPSQQEIVINTIQQLEREQLMPRITREAILRIAEKEAEELAPTLGVDPTLLLAKNKAYTLLKAFDNQIAELRAQL